MMAEILKIGVPTLVFQLLTSLSIALINRAASDYGDSVIAGMGAVTRITSMGTLVVFGFLKGFQPIEMCIRDSIFSCTNTFPPTLSRLITKY